MAGVRDSVPPLMPGEEQRRKLTSRGREVCHVSSGAVRQRLPSRKRRLAMLPSTRLGWWAVGLAAAFFPLVVMWTIVPRGAALGMLSAIAGGVCGLVAIVRRGERALAVFATVVPLAMTVGFVLAELLVGHD